MKLYIKTTIEDKETALVWWYEDVDPEFGSCHTKELRDHLSCYLWRESGATDSSGPSGIGFDSVGLRVSGLLVSVQRSIC